jgi:hypothetical protein
MCRSEGTSLRVSRCELALSAEPWRYAERHRDAIAAYRQRVSTERPKLFDGCVHVLTSYALGNGTLSGTFARTDFKSFLYWREHGAEARRLTRSDPRSSAPQMAACCSGGKSRVISTAGLPIRPAA